MKKAEIIIDKNYVVGELDPDIYGFFIEHLGRAVYEGIYQPGSPLSDENGFRKDVLEVARELNIPIVRYPGGSFVSNYFWEDGIGPKEERRKRMDLVWGASEPNTFGLDEFMAWADLAGTKPLMAVNLGTRGIQDALNILEYCNVEGNTLYSDKRIQNGHKAPYKVEKWCLGNEMDGPWETGQKVPFEYGRLCAQIGRAMKRVDPDVKLVACGSSGMFMPTFGSWEAGVLDECYDEVDYISLHSYYKVRRDDPMNYFAQNLEMDQYIRQVVAACDYIRAKKKGKKDIMLSFDEWGVGNYAEPIPFPKWSEHPHQLENQYTFADAILTGILMITLMKHADRVKIATYAQLVNAIGVVMTSDNGLWKHANYWPLLHASNYGRGKVLDTIVHAPRYDSKEFSDVPYLDSVVTEDEDKETLTVFAVNKSLDEEMEISMDLRQFSDYVIEEQLVLKCDALRAVNTEENKDRVVPSRISTVTLGNGMLTGLLPACSWNVIRMKRRKDL